MDQDTLVDELRYLGIDVEGHRALLALPLVHAAWIDNTVDPKEVAAIEAAVVKLDTCQEGEAARMLANWLKHKPSDEYFKRGLSTLAALCIRGTGPGRDIRKETIELVVQEARAVAAASGGFLGLRSISAAEQRIIDELAATFGPDFPYNSDDRPWEDPREEMWDTDEWEYEDEPVPLKLGVKKVEAPASALPRKSRGISLALGGSSDEAEVLAEDSE